ncbi:alpha-hydroxy-acid oxidizing protein [Ectothiorhodospiraceae bacterium WFHF3C12]|nr:alpha-hydroxy-acid oxidizing protein [Ectothiorhodospiraceae bacterium WFHF3C12]
MSSQRSTPEAGFARLRQTEIYIQGVGGRRPRVPTDMQRLEAAAESRMNPEAYAYIAGGAGSESTMRANRAAFERWRIRPRMMHDVSERDTTVEILGRTWPSPFMLAPIGVLEMAHRDADLAVARACAAEATGYIFSNQASVAMERTAAAMGEAPKWFQLYWSTSDELAASFVSRAEACGCEAIVVTLDTTLLGWRCRDLDYGYLPFLQGRGIAQYTSDPVFRRMMAEDQPEPPVSPPVNARSIATLLAQARRFPGRMLDNLKSGRGRASVQTFINTYSRPSLTWEDIPRLREMTRLPVLLKGITDPADAARAVDEGVDGLIVSNHGGRQVDGALATLDALPSIVRRVGGQIPVLMDSGVRTGADIFKAIALGADAVLLGRPYCYGLALDGEAGVQAVIRNLRADFELTMALAGCREVGAIGPNRLVETREAHE